MRLLILVIAALATAFAGERMPIAQQNALVGKYCAVCHTDVTRNGGLPLEHFDAAQVAPRLAAMMVSKLKHGAMGAAGIPIPDNATVDELIAALAAEAAGAREWSVEGSPVVTASILRDSPGATKGEAAMFRLVVTCNSATHEGDVQLAWAPLPKTGSLSAIVDRKTTLTYDVEGRESMGNGSPAVTGPAALSLYASGKMALPLHTLTFRSNFQTVKLEFPFSELSVKARRALAVCFQ